MIIKNVSNGVITISDLVGAQGGDGVILQPGAQVTIFNEDAERSLQLGQLITAGLVTNLGSGEATTGTPVGGAISSGSAVSITLGGDLTGSPSAAVVARVNGVAISGTPAIGQVILASGPAAAAWSAAPSVAPSGPAGGNLGGTYPNPSVASLPAISGALLTSLTPANISAGTAPISITGSAATAAPTGLAGGNLGGSFPNPTIASLPAISGAALTSLTGANVVGAVPLATSATTAGGAPPTGAASGDLAGSFPAPSVAKVNGITAPVVAPTAGQALFAASATALSYGSLPVAGGGTGAATLTGLLRGAGAAPIGGAAVVSLISEVSGTLPVANGGTGAVALPLNSLVVGAGTAAVASIAPGTAGQVLTSNGTVWASQSLPAPTAPAPFYASALAPLALINQFAWNSGLQTSNSLVAYPQPRAGSVTALVIAMSAATAAGSSTTFTLFKNGVATPLTVTIGAAISAVQTAVGGPVVFAANDLLSLNVTTTSTGPAVTFFPSLIIA